MAKKPALGRGLSALLPDQPTFDTAAAERVRSIPMAELHPNPDQPRKLFDDEKLSELAESIRSHGIMQPLLVMPDPAGGYCIVAGERRWRAGKLAGLDALPCIVRTLSAQQVKEQSLLENIQREDLAPLEEAAAYRDLMESHGYTQETLAARLGKSRPYVANTLRLLQLLPQERTLLEQGKLSAGHARALLALTDPRKRADVVSAILKQHLSVRQTEALVAEMKEAKKKAAPRRTRSVLLHDELARAMSDRLGMKVRMQGKEGRGRVIIDYTSEDDLQNLADALLGKLK